MELTKKIDWFGEPVGIKLNRSTTHKTLCGAVWTLLYFLVLCLVLYFTVVQFMDTTSPTVIQSESETGVTPEIDMNENGINFAVVISKGSDKHPIDSKEVFKYLSFSVMQSTYKNPASTDDSEVYIWDKIIMGQSCTNELLESNYKYLKEAPLGMFNLWKDLFKENAICFDTRKTIIRARGGLYSEMDPKNSNFTNIDFYIKPCDSSTFDCKPKSELEDLTISLVIPRYSTNYSNKEEPFNRIPFVISSAKIDLNLQTFNRATMKKTVIEDSKSSFFYFEEKSENSFIDIDQLLINDAPRDSSQISCDFAKMYKTVGCTSYMSIRLLTSGKLITVKRFYKGLLESIGDFGGVHQVVFLLFSVLNFLSLKLIRKFGCWSLTQELGLVWDILNADKDMETIINTISNNNTNENNKKVLRDKLRKAAQEMIDEYMDIRFIVKEICKLRVLFDYVFGNEREAGVPMIQLHERERHPPKTQTMLNTELLEIIGICLQNRMAQTNLFLDIKVEEAYDNYFRQLENQQPRLQPMRVLNIAGVVPDNRRQLYREVELERIHPHDDAGEILETRQNNEPQGQLRQLSLTGFNNLEMDERPE